jgi:hypothetical protein
MQREGFWLTIADSFMVEIAASLMVQHRSGTIEPKKEEYPLPNSNDDISD